MPPATHILKRCLRWLGFHRPKDGPARRRSTRYECSLEGSYSITAAVEGETFPATVRNISTDGVGLIISQPFEFGTKLRITLANSAKNITRDLVVRVAYTHQHPSGDWILGGSFTRSLSGTELQTLIG